MNVGMNEAVQGCWLVSEESEWYLKAIQRLRRRNEDVLFY